MTRWIRNRPDRRHDALAGLVATAAGVVVGAGVFYLTRLLVAREPLPVATEEPGPTRTGGGTPGFEAGA